MGLSGFLPPIFPWKILFELRGGKAIVIKESFTKALRWD